MTKKSKKKLFSIIVILISLIYGIYQEQINETFGLDTSPVFQEVDSNLTVSFLDVGQADSILIQNNEESMLIDAGNNEDGELLVKYFQEQNITNFKYVVGTHPHEDHIGGLDDVINNFSIETIYIPDAFTTTKTFTEVLDAIENKNMTYNVPKIGEKFMLGQAQITVIYTGTDMKELNNTSIVLKLTFGEISFLFTGDAEEKVEEEILSKDIQADVLKVGHHGSQYSSSDYFLDKVNPNYAIISVGEKNSYNHPHQTILNKLANRKIDVYRTDLDGTIVLTTDGKEISIKNKKTNTNG